MRTVPRQFAGLALEPKGEPKPQERETLHVDGSSGMSIAICFVAWNLRDFKIQGLERDDGHFLTLEIATHGRTFFLAQHNSAFWTTESASRVEAMAEDGSLARRHGGPVWVRRSDRYWPHLDGLPLPFLFQFQSREHYGYAFGVLEVGSLAVYLDPRDTQDVEDHYDQENWGRDDA